MQEEDESLIAAWERFDNPVYPYQTLFFFNIFISVWIEKLLNISI
jgi:hypothetical protein